jgi:hypothetical protein
MSEGDGSPERRPSTEVSSVLVKDGRQRGVGGTILTLVSYECPRLALYVDAENNSTLQKRGGQRLIANG